MRFSHHFQVSFGLTSFFPLWQFNLHLLAHLDAHLYTVGFHRYVVKNLTSGSLDEMVEEEVDEFDPPSEV